MTALTSGCTAVHPSLRPDITFSYAALTERCRWWMLPGVTWHTAANEFSEGGDVVHAALAALATDGVLELPERPELRAMYVAARSTLLALGILHKDGTKLMGLRAEVAYAIDLETGRGRELVDPEGWPRRWYADPAYRAKYDAAGEHGGPLVATEICGRLDLVRWGADDNGESYLEVLDYKCHFRPEWDEARAQLEIGALAAARANGTERVRATAVHLWADRDPVLERVGAPDNQPELGAFALMEIAARWYELAHPPANDPEPMPGPHCMGRYCPAIASCPTTAAIVKEPGVIPPEKLVRKTPGQAFSILAPIDTNEDSARTRVAIGLLKRLIVVAEDRVKIWSDAHGGTVDDDGKVYSGQLEPRESADMTVEGARELLESLGLGFAIQTEVTAPWGKIEELAGKPMEKRAREALRKIGAVVTSQVKVYRARTPKENARKAS